MDVSRFRETFTVPFLLFWRHFADDHFLFTSYTAARRFQVGNEPVSHSTVFLQGVVSEPY